MSKNTKKVTKKITRRTISLTSPKKPAPLSYKPALVIIVLLGLVYLGYRTLFRPQSVGINQVTGGTGSVTLALTPANSTKNNNTTRELTLEINAGTQHVSGTQVEITFDPAKCVNPTATQGSFLTGSPLVPVTVADGKITFTFVAPLPAPGEDAGKTGSGTLATITTGPKSANCNLTFTNNTEVYVTESNENALASASDATINLPEASLAPTPSPSILPSSTPTGCPSNYTTAQCQAYLQARKEKETSTQSVVSRVKECLKSQPLTFCSSKAFINCSATKPVTECLP